MLVVQVDDSNTQTLQATFARFSDVHGVSSDGVVAIGVETVPKLGGEEDLIPAPSFFEPSSEKFLVGMRAVDIAGIPLLTTSATVYSFTK
jgi:hypothetical protein